MPRRADDDRVKLLHGPYRAPRLVRDCAPVVTGRTDAPIQPGDLRP
jgi:hypothetical protein